LPPERQTDPSERPPALVIGEELVVRGGRIGLILAATARDVAREVVELALVVDRARRQGQTPRQLQAGATDESA
jgi:hypothetical protein